MEGTLADWHCVSAARIPHEWKLENRICKQVMGNRIRNNFPTHSIVFPDTIGIDENRNEFSFRECSFFSD